MKPTAYPRIPPSFLLLCIGLATTPWSGAQTARVVLKAGAGSAKIAPGDGAPVEAAAGAGPAEKSELMVGADAELVVEGVTNAVEAVCQKSGQPVPPALPREIASALSNVVFFQATATSPGPGRFP